MLISTWTARSLQRRGARSVIHHGRRPPARRRAAAHNTTFSTAAPSGTLAPAARPVGVRKSCEFPVEIPKIVSKPLMKIEFPLNFITPKTDTFRATRHGLGACHLSWRERQARWSQDVSASALLTVRGARRASETPRRRNRSLARSCGAAAARPGRGEPRAAF